MAQCNWADRLLVKESGGQPPQKKLQGVQDKVAQQGKQVIDDTKSWAAPQKCIGGFGKDSAAMQIGYW